MAYRDKPNTIGAVFVALFIVSVPVAALVAVSLVAADLFSTFS